MEQKEIYKIITFYEFKDLGSGANLKAIKISLLDAMRVNSVFGTIIIASEGYNSTVCGAPGDIENFVGELDAIFETRIVCKSSTHAERPFQKRKVRIKPEIVTLKKQVRVEKSSARTHIASVAEWNEIISDAETIVLDARNDYEFQVGTFKNAVNPQTSKFSDLPEFVLKNLDPRRDRKIAVFCTGGIRCEKFAPYLKDLGFAEVYQLSGGILKYLENAAASESLWRGECFVFDERTTVDEKLRKGTGKDLSVELKQAEKSR